MPEREIPQWAQRERLHDLGWIGDNLLVFWPAATKMFAEAGRGVLVVDTTTKVGERGVHPFGYLPQEMIEVGTDEDVERMLREYNPEQEVVVILLKHEGRVSSYRVQVRSPRKV